MRLKRMFPFVVLALGISWSSSVGGLRFTPIYDALTIKAQRNSPPHIAFEEIIESERLHKTAANNSSRATLLVAGASADVPLYRQRVQLSEMVITKNVELLSHGTAVASQDTGVEYSLASEGSNGSTSRDWMNDLSSEQAHRLREANQRSEVLSEDWASPSWAELAKETLEKSGVLKQTGSNAGKKVFVSGTDANGQTRTSVPQAEVGVRAEQNSFASADVEQNSGRVNVADNDYSRYTGASALVDATPSVSSLNLQGPLEITGGLAVTNEHHIEVRRSDEGVLKELGKVDLKQGLYNIQVTGTAGTILARLVNKDGKILGEGSYRLSQLATLKTSTSAPKIKIAPQPDFSGVTTSAYNPGVMDSAPEKTQVTFIKGVSEMAPKRDGVVAMDNVAKGSSTVMRAGAPKHLQTASIIVSGQPFRAPLYPEGMVKALQDIVAQQRGLTVEGLPTIIWGKASLDGKPVSGISVSVESEPSLQAVYFDQFMMPNPKLETTSDNGLFAFVSVTPGFHSLLAQRGEAIFGYSNVVVEEGSVAQGDVEATMKSESVPLRLYDAFTGEGQSAQITMQSLDDQLDVKDGLAMIRLPQISRLGMMRVQPEGTDYVAARYLYNDKDAFIHLPLVHWSWLSSVKNYLKIDDSPSSGVVVGFVPDEDFEVYLAAYDQFNPRQIVYFDMQGRILQNHKGIAGGGFILYGVPEDTHEVVVVGNRTQKIYSRVIPVDANSLSVLSFRE